MSKPPKIVVPGLNRGAGIPGGYILGRRRGSKQGPAELLNLTQLRGIGIATGTDVTTSTSLVQSIAHSETVSLSRSVSTSLSAISSSVSGAVSSTTSLSSAVSTVISGSISTVTSMVNSLSAAGGGGGGGVTAPTIRATKIESSSASSYALTWPVGTAANDIVLIMGGHGFAFNSPSGWVVLSSTSASNWNGAAFAKQMTAADIVAGGVTVTTGGAFNGVIAQLTFTGVTGDIRQTAVLQDSTGGSPRTLATSWTAKTTDMVVAFGSNRNADAPTCDYGAQKQQINATAASGVLNAASPGSNGTVTANFTYPTTSGTTGDYQVIIVVEGT